MFEDDLEELEDSEEDLLEVLGEEEGESTGGKLESVRDFLDSSEVQDDSH